MTQVKLKNSDVANRIPTASQLVLGELAINVADGKLYLKRSDNAIVCVGKDFNSLHKFFNPSDYLFNDFYSGSIAPFIEGGSGTGQSASFLTGTSTGYYRLNSGTAVGARRTIRTALDAIRLDREAGKADLFRSRFYVSNQTASDYSIIRLGFFNNESGTPTAGVLLEANLASSPNWRIITVGGSSPQTLDTGISINSVSSDNRDLRIAIADSKMSFYLDNFALEGVGGVPAQGMFFGATIIKTLGTTNNSISLDHLGGGVRQSL
ncbi:hypothetical protein [Leptolyngbya sp. NIES-2104]|uniref:hypothetical protein n=1 Tax=Leptolyngbya sp. NIES-2104 TaxID=1552121 RepID=UPI0006EC9C88|nr:hypothetical protein [Leptolyngbya sp. NIES-2104]GAP99120.1 hypothetical protein NIES2104_56780 [Leptolyngbya sp. NIES-2104]